MAVTGSAPVGLFAGLATLDVVYRVRGSPGPDEKVQALRQDIAAGGPAANAAVAFAALGGCAVLLTCLGCHPLARLAADELAALGVTVLDAAPDRTDPPAVSSVVVNDSTGQRSVVSVRGQGVPVLAVPELPDCDVVLVDGHHPELAIAASAHGSALVKPVVLDAGSWKGVLPKLLPYIDIAACSAAFRTPTADRAQVVAAELLHDTGTVLITRGPDPVLWWQRGLSGQVATVPVTAVDTLAAGDVFHGALVFAAARTPAHADPNALVAAIAFACRVAAVRCATAGPRAWLDDPRLAEVSTGAPV